MTLNGLTNAARSMVARVRYWPRETKIKAGAAVLAVATMMLWLSLRADHEHAGPLAVAKSQIGAVHADVAIPTRTALKSYGAGKTEERQGEFKAAAESYAAAARKGDKRGFAKLVAMTHSRKCEARAEAADTLADFRGKKARAALKKLSRSRFKDDKNAGIFSCNSRKAAQKALEKQQTRG